MKDKSGGDLLRGKLFDAGETDTLILLMASMMATIRYSTSVGT